MHYDYSHFTYLFFFRSKFLIIMRDTVANRLKSNEKYPLCSSSNSNKEETVSGKMYKKSVDLRPTLFYATCINTSEEKKFTSIFPPIPTSRCDA